MDFLKICQKYFNRYINIDELIALLEDFDLKKFSEEEQVSFNALAISINEIKHETQETADELIIKELEQLKASIEQFEKILETVKDRVPQELQDELDRMRANYKKPRDNFERWSKACDAIKDNKLYLKTIDSLSDIEMLEVIADDIRAARPLPINQETFENLIKAGIKQDEREWLWRLAFNYYTKKYDCNPIADYYIKCNDSYYLAELISAIGIALDIDKIVSQIVDQPSEKEFIEDFISRRQILTPYVTDEHFEKLKSSI